MPAEQLRHNDEIDEMSASLAVSPPPTVERSSLSQSPPVDGDEDSVLQAREGSHKKYKSIG
jgi:hypothetical protein